MLAACVATVGSMILVASMQQFGDFAKSPQTVVLNMGTQALVAGGKANLWFASVETGAVLEVRCARETRTFDLQPDEQTEECCGVKVRFVEFGERRIRGVGMVTAKCVVVWNDKK